ncbi:MAG: hypothetical protein ACXV2E_03975 [Halobacteriota archaeon]
MNRATISYREGNGEWFDDLYPESVPSWLLLYLLKTLKKRMPVCKTNEHALIDEVAYEERYRQQRRLQRQRDNIYLSKVPGTSPLGRRGV